MKTENSTTNTNETPARAGFNGKAVMLVVLCTLWMLVSNALMGQTTSSRQKVAVLNIDSKNVNLDPVQLGNVVRIELEKLDSFEVMDRYDVAYLIEKNKIKTENCYGKLCLVETGRTLGADKMLTGSAELYSNTIIYTLRLIDVKEGTVERTQVTEFLNNTSELQTMTHIMLLQLFNRPVNATLLTQLTKPYNYESMKNNPNETQLRLDGPRMGGTFFTGNTASVIQKPRSEGGFDSNPLMFQFGYQFEKQYLNTGHFQALFEFIPMITGLDQGLVIPSMTFMNGLRSSKWGLELAFGQSFSLDRKTDGYYVGENFVTQAQWEADTNNIGFAPPSYISRLDSRGDVVLQPSFVFGVGKTFRSGNLNIPVNVFVVPGREGLRYGLSVGYNARNRRK
ncbi:MAG: hypothetical protein ACRCYO_02315 [Bacteroidia bacterium]